MPEPQLRARRDGAAVWLTLDRPARHNALTLALLEELGAALAAAAADETVRAVVLHGAGRSFCSGADLDETAALSEAERDDYLRRSLAVLRTLDELPIPTIAAVHGYALAGGCELALVCDLVVADPDATFGLPETSVGMVPVVALAVARRRIGSGTLARLALAGDRLDGSEAVRKGLADVLAPTGGHLETAARLTAQIAAADPIATAEVTRLLHDAEPGYDAGIAAAKRVMDAARRSRS